MESTRTPMVTTASPSSPSKRRLSFSLIDSVPSRSASPFLSAAANHRSYATSTTPAAASAMLGRRPFRILRRCERWCCGCLTCLPLAFVYGLTTWAVWVEVDLGLSASQSRWVGRFTSLLGFTLYVLLNVCYTFAVFTDPGSPLGNTSSMSSAYDYSHLPTTETAAYNPLTVSSTGEPRYCRKCQLPKPDRAHHCSTCNRCILKMDHHCPWLATCVGFRNYKSFLLFLIYVSIFCWVCLAVTMNIIVVDVFSLADPADTTVGIGCFILAVLAGVLGLVLTGFTAWHISLVSRNLTTIESLERTRYVMSLRDILDHKRKEVLMAWNQGQLAPPMNIQKRQEAQEEARSRGQYAQWQQDSTSGRFSHTVNPYQRASYAPEHLHELERHYMYLDDTEAEALPHAFDRGWRENLRLLFGDSRLWWFLPTKNVSGDGWVWPINPKFANARRKLEQKRQQRIHDVVEGWRCFYWAQSPTGPLTPTASSGSGSGPGPGPGLVAQAGAWPRPKNPYALAAARQAEEEMRIDVEAMRHGDGGDEEQGGAGVSMKTLDFDRMGVQRGN